jgi:hypothetical protein
MKATIGEEGTEQFTVETRVDGKTIKVEPIHDPFINTTVIVTAPRWKHFLAMLRHDPIWVEVIVRGSVSAERAILTLDPEQMQRENEEILEARRISRESSPAIGHYAAEGGNS